MAATLSAALSAAEGTPAPCVAAVAHKSEVSVLAMRPDGEVVASADEASIHLWSVAKGTLLKTLTGDPPGSDVSALAFTPDGATLMSATGNGTVKLWRMPEGTLATTFSAHGDGLGEIAIGAAGTLLATGTTDAHGRSTIGLWALPDGRPLKTIAGDRVLHALAFTPDGKTLISAGNDNLIHLWSVPDGTPLRTLDNTEFVSALVLSSDGGRLVSGGWDGSLRLWSLPAGTLLATRSAHKGVVNALALSPDAKRLVSAGQDVRLWALPGLRPIDGLDTSGGGGLAFEALAMDARGRTLAVGGRGYEGRIHLFQLPSGARQPPCFVGHPPKPEPRPDVRPPADLDAALTGFFSGDIGRSARGRTAEFSLKTVAGRVSGSYYYSRIDKDIPIAGSVHPDGSFELQEEGAPARVTGRFQGRLTREPRISGTWTSEKGTSLSFSMGRRPVATPRGMDLAPVAPGDAENREVESHGIAYRMYTTPLGHRLPRLTRHRDAGVLRRVNALIESLARGLACDEPSDDTFGVTGEVHYADADIFSVYISTSWFCGAAYPTSDHNDSLTFDLRSGEIVDFRALFADYERDRAAILATIFAGRVERARRVKAGAVAPDECDGAFEMWFPETSTYGMSFSTSGLEVQPELPHVIAACAEIVTVPYERLRPFAASQGLLPRILR